MKKISIDVISDVICPWCFLGKRRLDKAIASVPELQVEVNFRPFFLDFTIQEFLGAVHLFFFFFFF